MTEREKLINEREAVIKKINQLENRQKVLLSRDKEAERRARNHRLIERGAMLESVFPELIVRENKDVMAFLVTVSRQPHIAELLAEAAKLDVTGQPSLD